MISKKKVCVFASGSGTNLQSLIDASKNSDAPYSINLVISNKKSAYALKRAEKYGIENKYIKYRKSSFEKEIMKCLIAHDIDIIVLAGFLRYIPLKVLKEYHNRIVNIHPALLPAFGGFGMYGLNVHSSVLDYGAKITGVTVHFVDENYDEGPVIAQIPVSVNTDDTPDTLQERVLKAEHKILPEVVKALSLDLLNIDGRKVSLKYSEYSIDRRMFGHSN